MDNPISAVQKHAHSITSAVVWMEPFALLLAPPPPPGRRGGGGGSLSSSLWAPDDLVPTLVVGMHDRQLLKSNSWDLHARINEISYTYTVCGRTVGQKEHNASSEENNLYCTNLYISFNLILTKVQIEPSCTTLRTSCQMCVVVLVEWSILMKMM